ncbi:hypothetical protein [Bacteroides reticulotermitis]|uniref:hypothetical protein n=1 Tax=Bacteroides reticulotermitis TaxID=1133319 RepID=UPI003A893F37
MMKLIISDISRKLRSALHKLQFNAYKLQNGRHERFEVCKQSSHPANRRWFGKSAMHLSYLLPLLLLGGLIYSCSSGETMTRRLFMQSRRVHLSLPAELTDSSGRAIVRESVTYQHADNRSQVLFRKDSTRKAKTSLSEVQNLDEVVVVARVKQKFAPERDGKIAVDFQIRVPKELLSADWRMRLAPEILHNDSIVPLEGLSLQGENFRAKQLADYQAFANYEESIIPESAYDSLFLNLKGIRKDMRRRQLYYWDLYNREFKRVNRYLTWKERMEERFGHFNQQKDGYRLNLYHSYMRRKNDASIRLLTVGVDTTGIGHKYENKFRKRSGFWPQYHLHRELTEKNVPAKYKYFFRNEPNLENLTNYTTTEKDSIAIARHRYFFEEIAGNESREKQRDAMEKKLIPFPFESGLRLDSLVDGGSDFVYHYHQTYPVTPGLDRIGVTLGGKVSATDRSVYTLAASDTLYYLISSLVQLADTSLIVRGTKLYRNMYDRMTIYPQFEADKSRFSIGYKDNRYQIDTLMNRFRSLKAGMDLQMDSLEIRSWASLDGSYDSNHELSRERAEALGGYLHATYPADMASCVVRSIPRGEDWQGLADRIGKRQDLANRDSILAMISRTVFPDQTEQDIRTQYRKDYRIIRDSIYPELRRMDIVFHLSRPGMNAVDSMQYVVKDGYEEGLRLLMKREYLEAFRVLSDYPDYNTALCLACMGYNGRAYDLLLKLPRTGDSEYLLAILCHRLERNEEAIEHLLESVRLDPDKAFRVHMDTEVLELVTRYNLSSRIEQIVAGVATDLSSSSSVSATDGLSAD